jgi:uncharacterized membrane protein
VKALLELLLVAWAALGLFAWILRDGLGPGAVDSSGFEAITRTFWTFWWGPSGILLALLWLGVTRLRAQPRADAAANENA